MELTACLVGAAGARDAMVASISSGFAIPALIGHALRPEQQRTWAAGSQHLLGRPPAVLFFHRGDDDHPSRIDASCRECRRIGNMRRRDEHDPFAGLRQALERRNEQAKLADALEVAQELDHRVPGPAATRQLRIQFVVAAGNCVVSRGKLIATPYQRMVQQFGQRGFHEGGGSSPAGRCAREARQKRLQGQSIERSFDSQPRAVKPC